MKAKLVAACSAALAFAACSKTEPPRPPARATPTPPAVATAPVAPKDAGMDFDTAPTEAQDVVGLSHQHRGRVDHLARAKELREVGDIEGALVEARRSVFDMPDDEDSLYQAATLAKLAHQRDVAIEAFERLGRIREEDPLPLLQEARLLVQKHDDDGAIEVAQEALVRDPENAEGFQLVGRAHLHKGELKEAIDAFQRCLEINPTQGFAMNNLGFAYLRANENEKALEFLTEAGELLPNVAYIQNNLGVALERLGKLDEAKLAYARATSLSPKYVKAQLNAKRMKKMASAVQAPTDPEDGSPVPGQPTPSVDVDE